MNDSIAIHNGRVEQQIENATSPPMLVLAILVK
jgi:hypothetical protein